MSEAAGIILPHGYVKTAWVFLDACLLQAKINSCKILLDFSSFTLPTTLKFLVSSDGLIYSELSGSAPLPQPKHTKGNIVGSWQGPLGFNARDSLIVTQGLSLNKKCMPVLSISLTTHFSLGFCTVKRRPAVEGVWLQ